MRPILTVFTALCAIGVFAHCNRRAERSARLHLFEAREFSVGLFSRNLLYRLHLPKHTKGKLPLVLYLHSGGSGGRDNTSQIEHGAEVFVDSALQAKHPCYVLAPQCPGSKQWVNTKFKSRPFTNYNQDEIPEGHEMKMIVKLIHKLSKELNIDTRRIYVTGFSMGGSGTWDIITRYPNLFAAAAPLSGVSDPKKAERIKHLPIWAFHGSLDKISRVENTRNMFAALKSHGSAAIFTELPDTPHEIMHTYSNPELIDWLFRQKKEN